MKYYLFNIFRSLNKNYPLDSFSASLVVIKKIILRDVKFDVSINVKGVFDFLVHIVLT